jgi:hypothetical protein
MRCRYFFAIFLFSGCANFDSVSNRSEFDRAMTMEAYGELQHARPYELVLRKAGAELLYLGVEHSTNPLSETNKILQEVFSRYTPTKLYVESPLRLPKSTIAETISSFGESGVLMYIANERRIEIESLDLPVREEMAQVAAKFGRETTALFYGLRVVLQQEQRSTDFNREIFLEQKAMPWLVLQFLIPLPALIKGSATLSSASLEWFNPLRPAEVTVFNEISRYLIDLRDQRMIRMLVADFRKGHKILAAAGVSHVVMQEPDIRRLIGCTPKQYDGKFLESPSIANCD